MIVCFMIHIVLNVKENLAHLFDHFYVKYVIILIVVIVHDNLLLNIQKMEIIIIIIKMDTNTINKANKINKINKVKVQEKFIMDQNI